MFELRIQCNTTVVMSTQLPLAKSAQAAAASLRQCTSCQVLLPSDPDYSDAIRGWNGALTAQPAVVVLCHSTADVQLAVKAAVSFGLPLSVRGGGYDSVGRGLCAGLVVGLQTMRHVAVDTSTETVTLDGGCTLRDVSMAVAAHSYAVVTGACSEVGLTGWTLGGGYGQLNGRYGMGVDNVVSAQVVLADGSLVTASADEDAELLWCCKEAAAASAWWCR